ncbi:hypothetical protein MY3296_000318 [Beauveria thailandica]
MPATDLHIKTARLSLRELPPNSHLVHATNCLATWGSGVAAELAVIFPDACKIYKAFCHAAKPSASDRWPPRSLAGQCLVIAPQQADIARGAPSVHIVCLFTSWGYGTSNRRTGKPGKDTADRIVGQTRTSLQKFRTRMDEAAAADGRHVAVYSPMFNSGKFRVPWDRTLKVIEEEFAGAKATWTVLLQPAQQSKSKADAPPYSAVAPEQLTLRLRYRKLTARSEIRSVGLSADAHNPIAYATFNGGQMDQVWLDVFELNSRRGLSKVSGGHATFAPPVGASASRIATLRDWTLQLGPGVEYVHSTSLLLRDLHTGKTALEIKGACGDPVAWSPDGRAVAAAEPRCHRVGVWDARSGALLGRVVSHIDKVDFAAFTPDMHLVTASRDGTLRITDPATSRTTAKLEIEGPGAANPRALVVADNDTMMSVWGASVHVWTPRANHLTSYTLASVRRTEGVPLALSPDGKYMLCWTEDGFDIMDVLSGETVAERPGGALVTAAAFSADASVVLLGRMDGFLEVWDIARKKA